MNKKTKLLIVSILSIGLCASAVFIVGSNVTNLTFASIAKPDSLDCSYYFNDSKYTSIYDLNVSKLDSGVDQTNTTWGTVTCNYQYYYQGNRNCSIIESTDKYGRHASTVLYDIGTTYEVGSVLTVTGTMTLYDGMSEMKNCSITKDYDFNPSPVEPLELTGPLPIKGDDEFNSCRYMGTKEVVINNVRLEYSSSNKSYAYFNDTDKIEIFYGSNTSQSLINTTAQGLNGKTINVHGYLNCYNYKNLSTNSSTLQVILRSTDDLEEVVEEKTVDHLYVSTDKSFYYMDEITMSDFTATVYYTDGSSSIVNNAYITNTVDTSTIGQHVIEFAYEHDGNTYTDSMNIIVTNAIGSIIVEDPIQLYAFNEEFITPVVYGKSATNEVEVTGNVEFTGFDSNKTSDYNGTVYASYINSVGRELTTSYDYLVTEVHSLTAINNKTEFNINEAFDNPTVYAIFSNDLSKQVDVSNRVTFSGFDSSSAGYVEVYISLGNYQTSYYVEIIDDTPAELYEYNVSISGIGKYDTGNYDTSGDFEYYRAVKETGYLCKLIPLTPQPGCEPTLDGALYNINPIKDIDHITFTYKTSSSSGSSSPKLFYGENSYGSGSVSINYSTSIKETTIDLSSYDVNYIKFTCGDSTLYLKDITIYYSGLNTTHGSSFVYQTTGVGEYRIAPTVYSGTLIDGVSYVDVPTSFDTSTCTVLSTKRYTYYSYEYVSSHMDVISDATITSPVDVCNYFQAFGCAPANFGAKGTVNPLKDGKSIPSVSEVDALFGSDARCISQYSRTTGYATSVPYYGSTPTYYELDIDTNRQYGTSSRQVGRIVAWATGFKGSDYGYGSQIVCTYTDDHYATFKEFNNFGGFLSRFNAERHISGSVRGNPTTLSN